MSEIEINKTMKAIRHHWQLDVYQLSVETGMRIFELSKTFPREELHRAYDRILGKLVNMGINPEPWLLQKTSA